MNPWLIPLYILTLGVATAIAVSLIGVVVNALLKQNRYHREALEAVRLSDEDRRRLDEAVMNAEARR